MIRRVTSNNLQMTTTIRPAACP